MFLLFVIAFYPLICLAGSLVVTQLGLPCRWLAGLHAFFLPDGKASGVHALGGALEQRGATAVVRSHKKTKKKKDDDPASGGGAGVWDDSMAQITRAKIQEIHVASRAFFDEFNECILFSLIGISAVAGRFIIRLAAPTDDDGAVTAVSEASLRKGDLIPILAATLGVSRVLWRMATVQYNRTTTQRVDHLFGMVAGAVGFVVACLVLFLAMPGGGVDFHLDKVVRESLRGFGAVVDKKVAERGGFAGAGGEGGADTGSFAESMAGWENPLVAMTMVAIATLCGAISCIFLPAAIRVARCHFSLTTRFPWDIGIVSQSRLAQSLSSLALALPVVTHFLWITPMASVFLASSPSSSSTHPHSAGLLGQPAGGAAATCGPAGDQQCFAGSAAKDGLASNGTISSLFVQGLSHDAFEVLRQGVLALSCVLALLVARPHVQAYLSSAAVLWYEQLHGGSSNLSAAGQPMIRAAGGGALPGAFATSPMGRVAARMQATFFFLCKVALQCAGPPCVCLLLIGVSWCYSATAASQADAAAAAATAAAAAAAASGGKGSGIGVDEERMVQTLAQSAQGMFKVVSPELLGEGARFLAWWSVSVWAVQTYVFLLMCRWGMAQ